MVGAVVDDVEDDLPKRLFPLISLQIGILDFAIGRFDRQRRSPLTPSIMEVRKGGLEMN